jgi:flagellar export protein FliJ
MKRFTFPLERVRQYRQLEMETEQARLEQAQARLQAIHAMKVELDRQRNNSVAAARRLRRTSNAVSMAEVAQEAQYAGYLRRMEQALESRRAQAQLVVDQQRQVLLEAKRRFEVLDRFRTRSHDAWQRALNREQEQLAGELYLARWKRRASL